MAWCHVATTKLPSLFPPNPNPNFNPSSSAPFGIATADVLPFLNFQLQKKLQSPHVRSIQPDADRRLPHFKAIVLRNNDLHFITCTKSFLADLPGHRLPLADAGKLHRKLGFPHGCKVSRFTAHHPLLHLPPDSRPYLAFTPDMESLLKEERALMDSMEPQHVTTIRKLLMVFARHRIPLFKLHHCRLLFGLPDDFRDQVRKYPDFFPITIDPNGHRVLELMEWDPALAISALERNFVPS